MNSTRVGSSKLPHLRGSSSSFRVGTVGQQYINGSILVHHKVKASISGDVLGVHYVVSNTEHTASVGLKGYSVVRHDALVSVHSFHIYRLFECASVDSNVFASLLVPIEELDFVALRE